MAKVELTNDKDPQKAQNGHTARRLQPTSSSVM